MLYYDIDKKMEERRAKNFLDSLKKIEEQDKERKALEERCHKRNQKDYGSYYYQTRY